MTPTSTTPSHPPIRKGKLTKFPAEEGASASTTRVGRKVRVLRQRVRGSSKTSGGAAKISEKKRRSGAWSLKFLADELDNPSAGAAGHTEGQRPGGAASLLEDGDGSVDPEAVEIIDRSSCAAHGSPSPSSTVLYPAAALSPTPLQKKQQHFILLALQHKLSSLSHTLSLCYSEWRQKPSKRALRFLGDELEEAIKINTFEEFSRVCKQTESRAKDPTGTLSTRPLLWLLHARALANFGVFCMVNYETQKAVQLLEESIAILNTVISEEDLSIIRQSLRSVVLQKSSHQKHGEKMMPPFFSGESAVLYLRVLLANALACEQRYWEASQQLQLVKSVRQRFLFTSLIQLSPGTNGYQLLCSTFIDEELASFYKNPKAMATAVAQAKAKLLLFKSQASMSEGNLLSPPHQAVLLSLARLHRQIGDFPQSQTYYEAYLTSLVEKGELDTEDAMQELGRMILFSKGTEKAASLRSRAEVALVYLTAVAEVLEEDVEEALMSQAKQACTPGAAGKGEASSTPLISAKTKVICIRAASAYLDLSHAFHLNERDEDALKTLDKCLHLLERVGLERHSVWALTHSADLLCTVNQVDQAISRYGKAIDLLRGETPSPAEGSGISSPSSLQVSVQDELVVVKIPEIEGHLGYCVQVYLGDHAKALKHYHRALQYMPPLTSSTSNRASTSTLFAKMPGLDREVHLDRVSADEEPDQATQDESLTLDGAHWILSNVVDCYAQLRDFDAAVAYQKDLIQVEAMSGVTQVDSFLRAADLLQQSGNIEKQLALYFYLFYLSDEWLSPATRLVVAQRFGRCCYQAGSARMGAVLFQAVQKAQGSQDPYTLVEYALCLMNADEERQPLEMNAGNLVSARGSLPFHDVEAISKIFRRAASLVVAHREIQKRDSDGVSVLAPCSPESELNALMVLSRGAFFFLEIGEEAKAMELYQTAYEYGSEKCSEMSKEYRKEWGIVLANLAMMHSRNHSCDHTDEALQLYKRAVEVSPTNLEVIKAATLFCQNENLLEEGRVFLSKALKLAHGDNVSEQTHMLLAQLGNSMYEKSDAEAKYLIMERIVANLGVPQKKLPSRRISATNPAVDTSLITEATLGEHIAALEPLLEDGIGKTINGQAANLACFMVLLRANKPQFLNKLFRIAITRFPTNHELLFNYANFCATHQFHDLARMYFSRSLALQNSSLALQGYTGYLQYPVFQGEQDGMQEMLLRVYTDQCPLDAAAASNYAQFLSRHFPCPYKVEESFERALLLDPQSLSTLSYFAEFLCLSMESLKATINLHFRSKCIQRVEQLLRQAVEVAPSRSTTHFHLAVFYSSADRIGDALTSFEKALELNPDDIETLRHISVLLKKECLRRKKEHSLAQQRSPSSVVNIRSTVAGGASADSAMPFSLQEAIGKATTAFERILELDPCQVETLEEYAEFCVRALDNPQKAKELWIRAHRAKATSRMADEEESENPVS